jgi:hypothetical protein
VIMFNSKNSSMKFIAKLYAARVTASIETANQKKASKMGPGHGGIYGVIQWGGEPAKRSGSAEPGAQNAPARGRRPSGGRVQGGGRPLPPRGSGGITPRKFLRFYMQNPAFRGTFRLTN